MTPTFIFFFCPNCDQQHVAALDQPEHAYIPHMIAQLLEDCAMDNVDFPTYAA